jgi:predicted metal-binding protein
MIEKLTLSDDAAQLSRSLERYVKIALDSGASDAAIVSTSQIVVDERVLMKCRFPLCGEYGACINCPPNTGTIAEMRANIAAYKYAIVMKLDVPGERIAGAAARGDEGVEDLKKLCKIISDVESAAFYDGYYFATGFSSASCHFIWCKGLDCQALAGKGCRHRARVYASMEAVGIDVFRLAVTLGWTIYPIGMSSAADIIPQGSRCGMVLIA